MGSRQVIVLPDGTDYVGLEAVPALIARALQPEPLDPKTTLKSVHYGLGSGRFRPCTDEELAELTAAAGMPIPIGRARATGEWADFLAALNASTTPPSWTPEPMWVDEQFNAALFRSYAEQQHTDALKQAIEAGEIVPLSPARVPLTEMVRTALGAGSISVAALTAYVSRFGVEVRIGAPAKWGEVAAQIERQDAERRAAGRYTLEEAAAHLSSFDERDTRALVRTFMRAAARGDLPVYLPGKTYRHHYEDADVQTLQGVREFYEEVYWDDVNRWLEVHEVRMAERLPEPDGVTLVPADEGNGRLRIVPEIGRSDVLTSVFIEAFERARNPTTADVYVALREMATAKVAPFTGEMDSAGALIYQDDDGGFAKVTKDALGQRLRRYLKRLEAG